MDKSVGREVVLDTETTGLSPESGDRVVEIGCIELNNHTPTGEIYHTYLNPERVMSESAFQISGISDEYLRNQPIFKDVASDFLDFVGETPIVAHNAPFDLGFINNELEIMGLPALNPSEVVDTLVLAREKFPGAQASLDALCRRFEVDNTKRVKHSALIDAQLLAEVYLELIGGRQTSLSLSERYRPLEAITKRQKTWPSRTFEISDKEQEAHGTMLTQIKNPLWLRN